MTKFQIPFFFADFVNNWERLYQIVENNPTDVYICEDLAFDIINVSDFLKRRGIRIRAIPNVAQSSWSNCPTVKKFFIRPEDVQFYEEYIDTFEFFGNNDKIYYKIYAEDKFWFGNLGELILSGSDLKLDSRAVLPYFATTRLNCNHKCLKGGFCKMCEVCENLSKTMSEKELFFKVNAE
jgi:hypothetical protein